eukprot:gnl/MRDRNA2_/MRDRNA2_31745_c0_seq2.p1 gnl/MRDRNA2_/MRDRNA2_31745_c0~~gnl/MRDRNA2_/MRDRNA2_31745_c0_seq2.p1  ORF type:complete len:185 (+),score=28.05 gnl/MRDRNA2_/MRDRNA2_31745_c0_seq2:123-677(+)
MYGLRQINNHYPGGEGSRGNWIVVGHQEFRHGRSQPLPFTTASLGRPCKKGTQFGGRGPRPVSRLREPPANATLSRSASDPATRCLATLDRVRKEYENSKKDKLPGLIAEERMKKKKARGGEAPASTISIQVASRNAAPQQAKDLQDKKEISRFETPNMGPPSVCTASRPCSAPGSRINTSSAV